MLLSASALISSSEALAHDGPLAGVDIRERNGHVLLVNSFGLVQSKGAGQPWTWMCEAAYGSGAVFEHEFEMSKRSQAIFATSVDGLLVSQDGCLYEPTTALGAKFISTIALADNGDLFAAAVDGDGSKIYRSTDDGVTFSQSSNAFRNFDAWRSIKFAPSAPNRIYISGVRVPASMPRTLLVYRSDDGGKNFTAGALTGITGMVDDSVLFIVGVSPTNPDVVYARLTLVNGTAGEDLYRSADAGMTWTKVLSKPEPIKVVVRRSGEVIVGTELSGTVRSTDGMTFAEVTTAPHLQCLVESNGTLYGCTQNFGSEAAAVMTSTDGATWTKRVQYQDISGPAECAAGTMQVDYCIPMEWCELAEQLTVDSKQLCEPAAEEPAGCCDTRTSASPALLPSLFIGLLLFARRRRR